MTINAATIIQTAEIPPIPHVLQQVLSLADNPNTTGAQLETIVSQEPALVTKLLKWVNSAFYALPRRVSSISHSMILLGFSTVKSIASGIMLINAFSEMAAADKEFVNSIWTHTLLGANFSKILSAREPMTRQDDLFLAAMIHDVGYIVLRAYFGKKYQNLTDKFNFPTPDQENEALGVNHVEIGTLLLKHWRFPEEVIELVRCHHNVNSYMGPKKDVAFLLVSDQLGYEKDLQSFFDQEEANVDPAFLKTLNLTGWDWPRFKAAKQKFLDAEDMTRKLFSES